MTGLYTWDGTAWVQHPPLPSVSGSTLVADTDKQTVTTLAQPTSPVTVGDSITLTATVTAGGAAVTAGSVVFERQSPGSSTWTALGTDSASPWTMSTTVPATAGTYKYRARYLGSGVNAPSTSASRSVVAEAASTLLTWTGYATSSRSYEADGSLRYDHAEDRCYHGYYSSTNGRQRSVLWFSIPSAVKGSAVSEVTLRMTRIGGVGDSAVTINMGTHTDGTVRSDWAAVTGKATSVAAVTAPAYSSSDVTFTRTLPAAIRDKFAAGAKGLLIGPPTSDSDYGAFHGVAGVGSSQKPQLTIKYTP